MNSFAHNALLRATTLLAILGLTMVAYAQPRPDDLQDVDVVEHLGAQMDLSLPFVDSDGRDVRLADYFKDGKPVLLTLNYYNCPMLCSLQLNALIEGIRQLDWVVGDNYKLLTISIDPREGSDLADAKRETYLKALGQGPDVDWAFLTGDERSIRTLSDQLGFEYNYVREVDEFAHPTVVYALSPEGTISRYLYGLEYRPLDLRMAVVEAGQGKIGTTVDRIILSCFHYDSSSNTYSIFAFGVLRIVGVLTLLLLGSLLSVLWVRERRRRLAVE